MPAERMVCTAELRFVARLVETATHPDAAFSPKAMRVVRILQQRWVVPGTFFHDELTADNSEWRDVPEVREG